MKKAVLVAEDNELVQTRKESIRAKHRRYQRSKKGKIASARRNCISSSRYREYTKNHSPEEIEEVRKFYAERPKGYEVDHIIPLKEGGEHKKHNLQYLTKPFHRFKTRLMIKTQRGDTDVELEFIKKSAYGQDRFYPVNENAKFLLGLMRFKTATENQLADMEDFGWTIKVVIEPFKLRRKEGKE